MLDKSINKVSTEKFSNLLVVDPNPCGSSVINTEDLSISVELEVFRRSDDIIIFDDTKKETTVNRSINPSETTRISFIDGSGEKDKFLTTHYTELNTDFSKQTDEMGSLGIQSIDISFNSAYTPIVNIKFKDIRGKLFEMGDDSPYSFLFRMPYPIFYLTVKGYYGKPVKYALHLTKFNGALDSSTGSFLITCDFIGYTYAFLSDILMGFLKAIPYTPQSKGLMGDLISFDDLRTTVTKLETFIIKYKQDDKRLSALTIYSELISRLDGISDELTKTLRLVGDNNGIIIGNDNLTPNNQVSYCVSTKKLTKINEQTYAKTVLKLVDDYNNFAKETDGRVFELNRRKFQLDGSGVYYEGLSISDFITEENGLPMFKTLEDFQTGGTNGANKFNNFKTVEIPSTNGTTDNNPPKDYNIISKLYNNFQDILKESPFSINGTPKEGVTYNFFDFRFVQSQINELKVQIERTQNDETNNVSGDFIDALTIFFADEGLGYNGSIGTLFKILCDHVDLFIKTLRSIGTNITTDIESGLRTINANNGDNFTEFEDVGSGLIKIKAFPEYVETNKAGDLVEKWIGSNSKFSEFKEVQFINDFFNAILQQGRKDFEFLENTIKAQLSWYPINPLETKAFSINNENPWGVISSTNQYPIYKLIIQRMVIYLGYTNKNFSDVGEIIKMAKIEANQLFNNVDNSVKSSVSVGDTVNDDIKAIKSVLTTKYGIKFVDDGDELIYYHQSPDYDYNSFSPVKTFIPITQSSVELKSDTNLLNDSVNRLNRINSGLPFISDLSSKTEYVEDEYESFIKIMEVSDYEKEYVYDKYVDGVNTDITTNIDAVGFFNSPDIETKNDSLGGRYKTHEFITYNHKNGLIPLFYEFYETANDITHSYRINNDGDEYNTYLSNFEPRENASTITKNSEIDKFYENSSLYERLLKIQNDGIGDVTNINFKFQPKFTSFKQYRESSRDVDFSLFGSEFYYAQSNFGKAFLFLHSIPFKGLTETFYRKYGLLQGNNKNYFNQRGGFVSTPYPWILFLGALLYRIDMEDDIITFVNNSGTSLLPNVDDIITIGKDKYLTSKSTGIDAYGPNINFRKGTTNYNQGVDDIIIKLPQSVKDIFRDEFEKWVESGDRLGWEQIKLNLEIFEETVNPEQRETTWENFTPSNSNLRATIGENYFIVTPSIIKNNFILDIRDDSKASNILADFLLENKIILNSTYRIWEANNLQYSGFKIKKTYFDEYLKAFLIEFNELVKKPIPDSDEAIKQKFFNTNNNKDIKLSLYKNIKSIYDKWIVGIPQNQESVVVTELYERFRFIDRSYTNIADKFKIAPTSFINLWSDNTNVSFYNFISKLLNDNNFDFIPLPTFIDYNSEKDVSDVFKPFRFNEEIPSKDTQFICMYMGENSNKLNIDKKSKFKKNDSFSIDTSCDNGNLKINDFSDLPNDFKEDGREKISKIPYILVNYADQNQSIFKSFSLDQKEFVETQESLEIIESLSTRNRNSSIGQNLFDIYNNRAYSAEIEMLGCAQIQPFMYFQLNNVPMFDGAYTIINTRHHIKANHMTTTFKGVRIRSVKTKMIDNETLYTHLITNLNDVNNKSNRSLLAFDSNEFNSDSQPAITNINGVITQNLNGIIIKG